MQAAPSRTAGVIRERHLEVPRRDLRQLRPLAALLVLAVAAAVLSLYATSHGPGSEVDSAAYLGTASNLVHGRGPTEPMTFYTDHYRPAAAYAFHGAVPSTHFPPLYPAALASLEMLGVSQLGAARALDVVLCALNFVLVAMLLSRVLRRTPWLVCVAGAAVLAFVPTWMYVHTFVLSEPLLLSIALAALLAIEHYLTEPTPGRLAVVCGCAALAVLTRWVGASVGITGAALVLWQTAWPLRSRMLRAAAVLGSALGAAVGWAIFGVVAGGAAPRLIAFHPPLVPFRSLAAVMLYSFLRTPTPVLPPPWVLVLGAIVVAGAVLSWRRLPPREQCEPEGDEAALLLRTIAVFVVVYVLIMIGSATFVDASIPASVRGGFFTLYGPARMYVPIIPLLLVLMLAGYRALLVRLLGTRAHRVPVAMVAACVALVVVRPVNPFKTVVHGSAAPRGPMLTAIRALPSSTIIATDDPSYVYAGTGRDLLTLPTNTVLVTGRPNRRLSQDLAEMASILCRHDSVVAVGTPAFYMTSFSAGELAPYARLTLVGAYPDGTLYRVERC